MINVLHVTSVNPKYHPGGLSRYCIDLFKRQKMMQYNPQIIYAGKLNKGKNNNYKIKKTKDGFFRFDGALPISTIFGIDNPQRYIKIYNKDNFYNFFYKNKFDVVHIHSIQGFPIEFFEVAKELNCKLVFTTHDYYPFCFKYNLFDFNNEICTNLNLEKCILCSKKDALTEKIQILKQNPISDLKLFNLIKKIIFNLKISKNKEIPDNRHEITNIELTQFNLLREYNIKILKLCDVIHCNSELTKIIYKRFCPFLNYVVVPITHTNIISTNKHKSPKQEFSLHIGYYGGHTISKGFDILNKALDIVEAKKNIKITTEFYGGGYINKDTQFRHYHERLEGRKLNISFQNIDIVIVPSQWYETFGFLVVESLAKKIPVIVSDIVGSKNLVAKINPNAIFEHQSVTDLANKIIYFSLNNNYYEYLNRINLPNNILDMDSHIADIEKNIYSF